jgi:uncharacterized 2Fe-2S/4Fe-4S cluster protein (DUF4445 family)
LVANARFGIALDIGTSKLEGLLVNLSDKKVISRGTLPNSQAAFGRDVITRLGAATSSRSGIERLHKAIVDSIETLITSLIASAKIEENSVSRILCVGNSAMHHLALSIDPKLLAQSPFRPSHINKIYRTTAGELGLKVSRDASFEFLPNLGGFVGSDALAVIVKCGIYRSSGLVAAIDLGTNGEVIIGDRKRILVASTSAGAAFEGWRISCGMPASDGAIESVALKGEKIIYKTIGSRPPQGLCGSGLIDLLKTLLEGGLLDRSGRIKNGKFRICDNIYLTQADVREAQLAKAAVEAAFAIVRTKFGPRRVEKVFLTGRFGNRISKANARAIGIVPGDIGLKSIAVLSHGALEGVSAILLSKRVENIALDLYNRITHVELHREAAFEEEFIRAMRFER